MDFYSVKYFSFLFFLNNNSSCPTFNLVSNVDWMHFHVNGSMVEHSSVHDPAHSLYLHVISAAQPHTEKGATPIRLSEANTSTPGASDCILGHNNDILSPHGDGPLDRERAAESLLITLESDLTAIWIRLVLMALCVYYLLHLIKLWNISNAPVTLWSSLFTQLLKFAGARISPGGTSLLVLFVLSCIITVVPVIVVNTFSGFIAGGFLCHCLSDQERCAKLQFSYSLRMLNLAKPGPTHTTRMSSEEAEFPL